MSNPNYTKQIISDYVVLDTETTGLSAYYDEVIEIGLVKVRNDKIVDTYSQLIKPCQEINGFITMLTGITNEMLEGMPSIVDVKDTVLEFIGEDIIIGHNTSFDLNFIKCGFDEKLSNKYMDTMQFARKVFPEFKHHRLKDLTKILNISNSEHRALSDCISTKELYDIIKQNMIDKNLKIENLWAYGFKRKKIDLKNIKPTANEIDEDNFFFGRHIVFTGKLEKMERKDAMQLVVNLGAILDNSVRKETNYLILGNNDYNAILKGEKSNKHKKAEKYILEGQDLSIMDEFTFYDLLGL